MSTKKKKKAVVSTDRVAAAKKAKKAPRTKKRVVEIWVDREFRLSVDAKPSTSASALERLQNAILGQAVYWGTNSFGYAKKLRITVEETGETN